VHYDDPRPSEEVPALHSADWLTTPAGLKSKIRKALYLGFSLALIGFQVVRSG